MPNPKSPSDRQDTSEALDHIASFIRRYLVCDDHQLLTLWTACAHGHHHFGDAPYLHVRSAQPCSGRSLCLSLLNDLSNFPLIFTGIPAAPLIQRLIQGRSLDLVDSGASLPAITVFIDDYHHSFGPSERQPVVALLASGSEVTGYFAQGEEDYYLFGPKAFAGNSALPQSLATRCIPIHLRPPRPSEKFIRYWGQDISAAWNP